MIHTHLLEAEVLTFIRLNPESKIKYTDLWAFLLENIYFKICLKFNHLIEKDFFNPFQNFKQWILTNSYLMLSKLLGSLVLVISVLSELCFPYSDSTVVAVEKLFRSSLILLFSIKYRRHKNDLILLLKSRMFRRLYWKICYQILYDLLTKLKIEIKKKIYFKQYFNAIYPFIPLIFECLSTATISYTLFLEDKELKF